MNLTKIILITAALVLQAGTQAVLAQGTAFNYNGRLLQNGAPTSGDYDFILSLFDAAVGGNALMTQTNRSIGLTNGTFNVSLDFGVESFNGEPRWIQVAVREAGTSEPFTTMEPRHPIAAVPYAIRALNSPPGIVGPQGPPGPQGIPGLPGPEGPAGADALSAAGINAHGNEADGSSIFSEYRLHINATGLLHLNPFDPAGDVVVGGGDRDANLSVTGNLNLSGFGSVLDGRYILSNHRLHIQSGERLYLNPGGTLGEVWIGGGAGDANLYVTGDTSVKTLTIRGGADLAEPFEIDGAKLPEGSVVIIDSMNPGKLKISSTEYDKRVAGIISGANGVQPGLSLIQQGKFDSGQNVALTGRVYALADATMGSIEPGDLLTSSITPGHCMKAANSNRAHGAIIGKAMSRLEGGKGMVLVLVSLQ